MNEMDRIRFNLGWYIYKLRGSVALETAKTPPPPVR